MYWQNLLPRKRYLLNEQIRKSLSSHINRIKNIAIVGSGPAGFYTAQKLLKHPETVVDIYERLPVPFGLVRFGVAPDHEDVKKVINSFTTIGENERVSFLGNINVGRDVALNELLENYHAVVLCYGSGQDRMLGISGEKSDNVISARNFVGWYNGDPNDRNLRVNLTSSDSACIVGHGNVALDCARILLSDVTQRLSRTDIAIHAQKRLLESCVRNVYLVGRRGPFQVAFTVKEFRELTKIPNCNISVDLTNLPQEIQSLTSEHLERIPRPRRRLTELIYSKSLSKFTENTQGHNEKNCIVKFLLTPSEILPKLQNSNQKIIPDQVGQVDKIKFARNRFLNDTDVIDENATIQSDLTDIVELNCGLVIRSIGFKAILIDDSLPYDSRKGAIINTDGKIQGFDRLYCSGWLATGATGVIADTLQSSIITAQTILSDIEQSDSDTSYESFKRGKELILQKLCKNNVQIVHFSNWLRINEIEQKLGQLMGKPREKFVSVEELLDIAKQTLEH